jgi:hypothetical protein
VVKARKYFEQERHEKYLADTKQSKTNHWRIFLHVSVLSHTVSTSAPPLYGYLQTEPKNPLLPLPTGLDRFLPVHQIHLLTFAR